MTKAYLKASFVEKVTKDKTVFAKGCDFYKIVMLFLWSIPGRYHGDDFLPHHSRGMDEPQQCGVGTIQYRVGTCDCNGDSNVI